LPFGKSECPGRATTSGCELGLHWQSERAARFYERRVASRCRLVAHWDVPPTLRQPYVVALECPRCPSHATGSCRSRRLRVVGISRRAHGADRHG